MGTWSRFTLALLGGAVVALGLPVAGSASPLGPSPYLSFADSPFSGGTFAYFELEDFESGALSAPGVTASTGRVLAPGDLTDSVDGDDGTIGGFGRNGHSWLVDAHQITFTFDAGELGSLPTHVGIVWTDVGYSDDVAGYGHVTFESFDELGDPLDTIGPVDVGDGAFGGQTAEDRFFGSIHLGGISKIRITMNSGDWEIDHLQFGATVPEPGTLSLVGSALLLLGAARRR